MSLWAGFLGDLAGPLVRYGAWKKFTVPEELSIVGTWECVYMKRVGSQGEIKEDLDPGGTQYTFRNDNTGEIWDGVKGRSSFSYRLESSGSDFSMLILSCPVIHNDTWQVLKLSDSEFELYTKDSHGAQ